MREDEESQLLVVCNFFDKQVPCKLLEEWEEETLLIGNYEGSVKGQLRPYEARMYLKRK
jgi:glucan 1,6-alpha-glucosidase